MFSETLTQAFASRYAVTAPDLPDFASFLNHRSVRRFADKPIGEDTIFGLVAAAQSASTSSNLQLYSMVSVQDPERREAIAKLCSDQAQIRAASWFFAFCADHHRVREAARLHGETAAGLDHAEFYTMAVVDAALAAERMVCAAEHLGIGVCYIGALRNDPQAVRELLGLPDGVFGLFGLCLGWPEEPMSAQIKPRLSHSAVWFREQYNPSPDLNEFDERMRPFYESQNMKGEVTWTMRSARRVNGENLEGRESQLRWLQSVGFLRR